VVPSKNSTAPVAALGDTFAVKTTLSLRCPGLSLDVKLNVVAFFTAWVKMGEELPFVTVSPP
jgi:hypothetical protein